MLRSVACLGTLFAVFFVASPDLPGLAWFPRVRPSLSHVDNRLVSLLVSGCPASSTLPHRLSRCPVHGDFSSSTAVPVFLLGLPACPTLGPSPVVASLGCWLSLRVCAGPSVAAELGPTSLLLLCAG